MSFVVEDGTGLPDATSFCSVEFADEYHADYTTGAALTTWTSSTTEEKQTSLMLGTQSICADYAHSWNGEKVNGVDQSLPWPQYGATDNFGLWISSTSVPIQIKQATAILGLKSRQGDTLIPDDSAGSNVKAESVTLGAMSVSKTYSGGKETKKRYSLVERLIGELVGGGSRVYRS